MKHLFLFLLLILLGGGSCRKQTVEPDGCAYIITRSVLNISSVHTYRFDAANRLISIMSEGSIDPGNYTYTYQGSGVTVDFAYPGYNVRKTRYILTFNGQGYVVAARKTNTQTQANGTAKESVEAVHTFSYDADGYLTAHRRDQFRYPIGEPERMETYREQFVYQNGNPVTITYSNEGNEPLAKARGTIINQYGTQVNRLKIPLQLEASSGFSLDRALQPFLGKPPRNLLDRSDESLAYDAQAQTRSYANRYEYQLDVKGQILRITQQPGAPNTYYVAPPILAFDNRCP